MKQIREQMLLSDAELDAIAGGGSRGNDVMLGQDGSDLLLVIADDSDILVNNGEVAITGGTSN